MIVEWLRLAVMGFFGLTPVYLLVSLYARSLRREALEKEWDAGDRAEDRDKFIATGMQAYGRSLRRRLILLVYIVPAVAVPTIIYVMNFK
jgi:hypothetical protein